MKVRFARWYAAFWTAAGLALAALAVVLLAGGNTGAGFAVLASGVVLIVLGGPCFGPLPYLVVGESFVGVPVVAGGQGRVTIGRGDRLRMHGDRLVVAGPGDARRVPAYRALAHRDDWDRMAAAVRERRLGWRPAAAKQVAWMRGDVRCRVSGGEVVVGVDFGTSNTAVVLQHADGRVRPVLFVGALRLSSAVFLDESGIPLVGRDALHAGRWHPHRLEPYPSSASTTAPCCSAAGAGGRPRRRGTAPGGRGGCRRSRKMDLDLAHFR